MSGPGGGGSKAGSSITSSSKVARAIRPAGSELTGLLGRTWAHASGQHMTIARLAIDTGFETSAVYAWSRAVGFAQVAPVKGVEGFNRASPVTGPTYVDATIAGKRLRRGARLWTVATSTFKAETYRFLRQDRPTGEELEAGAAFPPGTIHLPDWADGEWLKQLTAEQLVTVQDETRLPAARMAEASRAQRGARHPRLCPCGRLDRRCRPLVGGALAGAGAAAGCRCRGAQPALRPVKSSARPSAQRRTVRSSYMG